VGGLRLAAEAAVAASEGDSDMAAAIAVLKAALAAAKARGRRLGRDCGYRPASGPDALAAAEARRDEADRTAHRILLRSRRCAQRASQVSPSSHARSPAAPSPRRAAAPPGPTPPSPACLHGRAAEKLSLDSIARGLDTSHPI
jgi:hypothetical protein